MPDCGGLIFSILFEQAEIEMRFREIRPLVGGLPIKDRGVLEIAQRVVGVAQIVMSFGEFVLYPDGLFVFSDRFPVPPEFKQNQPKVMVSIRNVRLNFQSKLQPFARGFEISALAAEHTQKPQGILLARLAVEHFAIEALRFVQAAFLVVCQGGPQK